MTDDRPDFEVMSAAQVMQRHRLYGIRAAPIVFDEAEVPDSLKHLIPLARVWGVGDDVFRDEMRQHADPQDLKDLKQAVADAEDDLDNWLTSPKALSEGPSSAYLAFTNLRMVADAVRI